MRSITFEEKEIIVRPEIGRIPSITKTVSEIKLVKMMDTSVSIVACLQIDKNLVTKTLWEKEEYQPLSKWTTEQIDVRILELL